MTCDPKTYDPETRDPTTCDPETCDPKEAGVQEARGQEARIQEVGIQEARDQEVSVQEDRSTQCLGTLLINCANNISHAFFYLKLNVQCCPTLDEPENIKLINKNAKIYSAPGLKRKTCYKTVTRTPKHKKLQSRLLTPSAPTSMLGNLLGEQTMLLQMWFFIYPAEKTSCGNTFQH